MIAILRGLLVGFIVLTLFYLLILIYARSRRREALENRWAKKTAAGIDAGPRDAFVARGMRRYEASIRRRLLIFVYIIPLAIMAATIYVVNYL